MDDDESAAVADVVGEVGAEGLRPEVAVVVEDEDVVVGEFGIVVGPGVGVFLGALRGGGGDGDGESAGVLEDRFEDGGAGFPVVVILAVDDEGVEFVGGVGGGGEEGEGEKSCEGQEQAMCGHGISVKEWLYMVPLGGGGVGGGGEMDFAGRGSDRRGTPGGPPAVMGKTRLGGWEGGKEAKRGNGRSTDAICMHIVL